jgi:hypothetical protein
VEHQSAAAVGSFSRTEIIHISTVHRVNGQKQKPKQFLVDGFYVLQERPGLALDMNRLLLVLAN